MFSQKSGKAGSRKQAAKYMVENISLSQRAACRLAGISRSAYVYRARPPSDAKLRERLQKLTARHSSYGFLFLHALLKKDKLVINIKRTYRIYREEGLQVRTKARKKLQRPRMPMEMPNQVNQRWSMDFVADQVSNGRRFRVLNVVDDYNRQMIGQLVSIFISGSQVARFLDDMIPERQRPKTIICDNGTEFTSKAMFFWSQETGAKLGFIQPGKPMQNAFIESLNGKFRKRA
jgi:putative transposase